MSRRIFTRTEMTDAIRLAAEHGMTLRFQSDGDMVMTPATASLDISDETSAESALNKWKAKRGKITGCARH